MDHEQPVKKVIARGPTLAGDSNKTHKTYRRYAMINCDVLFNMPAPK